MRPVTWKEKETDRLPDWAVQGFVLVRDLERRGLLEPLSDRVRIRREGGYAGIDIVLVLLYYFASGLDVGLRKFWERASPWGVQLAAVADRRQLASPASVSRALEAVEFERVRPLSTWLLAEVAGVDDVLRHPAVQHYDANGEGWHVFDFDPTVTTLRHRALPDGEDLPAVRRRSAETAEAGYSGRKRGDVQFRRATLQHAGSGLWLGAELRPGNGARRSELRAALTTVATTCRRLGAPLGRALVRMDGEFGSVPYYAECREQGVPFITRLNRLELLDDPAVRRRLVEGIWAFVPDDRSGVRRSAMDLGVVTVSAGRDTLRDDGTPYEPPPTAPSLREALAERLPALDWEALLAGRPEWTWDADVGVLRCPQGKALTLTCVDVPRPGGVRFIFRGAVGACEACPRRQECFASAVARRAKMVNFTVDRASVSEGPGDGRPPACPPTPGLQQRRRPTRRSDRLHLDDAEPDTASPGTNAVHTPLFRPAEARAQLHRRTLGLTTYVGVELPKPPIPQPALLARSVADRQHRRRTWQQHLDRYALPAGSRVTLTVAGSPDLAPILGAGAGRTGAVA